MQIGLALSASLTVFALGFALYILRKYVERLASRPDYERRSGLLPAHVVGVSAWSIAVCARMTIRDQYVDQAPPPWMGWPLTVVLVLWLIATLTLIVVRYRGSDQPNLREQ